jgi:hypothetical protein
VEVESDNLFVQETLEGGCWLRQSPQVCCCAVMFSLLCGLHTGFLDAGFFCVVSSSVAFVHLFFRFRAWGFVLEDHLAFLLAVLFCCVGRLVGGLAPLD